MRGLAELVDLYPTLAGLLASSPRGRSTASASRRCLDNPKASVKYAAFTQAQNGYTVRTERWRYIEWGAGQEGVQLYDMERDSGETTNLAQDAQHAATVADLKGRLAAYRR